MSHTPAAGSKRKAMYGVGVLVLTLTLGTLFAVDWGGPRAVGRSPDAQRRPLATAPDPSAPAPASGDAGPPRSTLPSTRTTSPPARFELAEHPAWFPLPRGRDREAQLTKLRTELAAARETGDTHRVTMLEGVIARLEVANAEASAGRGSP